ncbi:MAG: sugar phosphate nucleotidyltransferase [Firmicutes bacterium]|nr:sugar phosphate nucleotidyltransferase [Bacillota bacterium]
MNAVILAGGFGTRLQPLTDTACKPMLSVGNMPMIDYTISHLWEAGVRDFVFTLGYKPEQVIDWCIGYTGAQCRFSVEHTPLGSLGGVKAVEPFLKEHFFVISGDIIEDINLYALAHKHITSGAKITMAVVEVEDSSQYGVVEMDGWGKVTGFIEKPIFGGKGLVNTGVYVVDKNVLLEVPSDVKMDFAKDLLPMLVERGELSAYIHDGYWQDLGTIGNYFTTNFDLINGGFFKNAPNSFRDKRQGIRVKGEFNNLVASKASVFGRIRNSIVAPNATVMQNANINNCIVLDGAFVRGEHHNSIIAPHFVLPVDILPNYKSEHTAIYDYGF